MPDKKNRAPNDDIVITDKGLEAFKTFGTIVDARLLNKGMRTMLNYALRHEIFSHTWFEDFLEELEILNDFLDDVEDEYGPPT